MIWREKLSGGQDEVVEENQLKTHSDTVRSAEDVRLIEESKFWEEHHSTFGNYKKVFPMVMLVGFPTLIITLSVIPWIICDAANHDLVVHVMAAIHFVCYLLIFGLILYWIHRIGQIADKFGIGTELKAINLCFVTFVIAKGVAEVIEVLILDDLSHSGQDTDQLRSYYILVATMCNILSILPSMYIGSFFVLRRLFSDHAKSATLRGFKRRKALRRILFCGKPPDEKNDNVEIEPEDDETEIFTLNEVLSTKIGFEKFTQFLISELSVENILFLIEVKQFKACCRALLSYISSIFF